MTVSWAGGNNTTSDVDGFMQTVAQHHDSPGFGVSVNAAGEAAVEQAMNCVLDTSRTTLSSLVLNQEISALTVRTSTLTVSDGSLVVSTMSLDEVVAGCSGGTAIRFTGSGDSVNLGTGSYGSHDLIIEFGTNYQPCFDFGCQGAGGQCLEECEPDGSEVCRCHGAGGGCGHGVSRQLLDSSGAMIDLG